MSRALTVLPDAMSHLTARLREETDLPGLAQVLRALQRLGLQQVDLQVHLERLRAVNDSTDQDPTVEANCLVSLDIVTGLAGDESLRWDAGQMARILLPRVITQDGIAASIEPALSRSDLIPPRTHSVPLDDLHQLMSQQLAAQLAKAEVEPRQADFFRVPKVGVTTRPAALLAPTDRMCWEALAAEIEEELGRVASANLTWPRGRQHVDYSEFAREPLNWQSTHLVRADIESFYESVDHALLSLALGSVLQMSSTYTRAVEAFLDSVMGSTMGLPQGPPASELFASSFLLLVDRQLDSAGFRYVRYADDYIFEANSVLEGRRRLEQFESALREIGLRLSTGKTKVLKTSTYRDNIGSGISPRVLTLRAKLRDITEDRLRSSEDPEDVEDLLISLGASEQTLFDLLYHRTTSLDEVIDEIRDQLSPTLVDSYATFVNEEAGKLRSGVYPTDSQASQADLGESLLALASARKWVGAEDAIEILTWHPALSPTVSAYARNLVSTAQTEVRDLLDRWLQVGANTDWVQSWACSAAEIEPSLVDDNLAEQLERVALSGETGPLTRAGAARALAAARRLTEPVWRLVLSQSSVSMTAELYLDAASNPQAYPIQSTALGPSVLG